MKTKLKNFTEQITKAESILLLAHKNPDGDALCSVLALARLIELNFNMSPVCVYDGNIPDVMDYVPMRHRVKYWPRVDASAPFDLAVVMDYGTVKNIGGPLDMLQAAKYSVEIDHHKNTENIANLSLSDDRAVAVGEILFNIMIDNNWVYDMDVLNLLGVSILTDSGFFKFDRTGSALRIMGWLVEHGVRIDKLADLLNNRERKNVQMEAAVVANTEFFWENKLAVAIVPRKEYKKLDGRGEIILNLLAQIRGVEIIALLKEQKDCQTGISLRGRNTPVNNIAEIFGGGGHEFAAGAVVCEPIENVKSKVIEICGGEFV